MHPNESGRVLYERVKFTWNSSSRNEMKSSFLFLLFYFSFLASLAGTQINYFFFRLMHVFASKCFELENLLDSSCSFLHIIWTGCCVYARRSQRKNSSIAGAAHDRHSGERARCVPERLLKFALQSHIMTIKILVLSMHSHDFDFVSRASDGSPESDHKKLFAIKFAGKKSRNKLNAMYWQLFLPTCRTRLGARNWIENLFYSSYKTLSHRATISSQFIKLK